MSDERNVNLMGYLPPYYRENKEMIHITEAENPEIDELWKIISEVKNNQFISDSDDYRIRQWEKLLRIRADYTLQSLDFRKAVVIMRLSTRLPLTYRWLKEKTDSVVGKDNYTVNLRYLDYLLEMYFINGREDILTEYIPYLREKIPANLGLGVIYRQEHSQLLYTGIAAKHKRKRIFTAAQPCAKVESIMLYAGCVLKSRRKTVIRTEVKYVRSN